MKPYINDKKCIVDPKICTVIKACTQEAITYIEDEKEPLGGKIIIDYSKCNGCGICADICCGSAIEIR